MADIEKIKKIRSLSGAGFKDCSLAMNEAQGDIEKAIEILRVKGISKASKKLLKKNRFLSSLEYVYKQNTKKSYKI